MKISLRPVTREDGKLIVEWRNSKSVSSHCFDKRPITLESNEYFFEHFVEKEWMKTLGPSRIQLLQFI